MKVLSVADLLKEKNGQRLGIGGGVGVFGQVEKIVGPVQNGQNDWKIRSGSGSSVLSSTILQLINLKSLELCSYCDETISFVYCNLHLWIKSTVKSNPEEIVPKCDLPSWPVIRRGDVVYIDPVVTKLQEWVFRKFNLSMKFSKILSRTPEKERRTF